MMSQGCDVVPLIMSFNNVCLELIRKTWGENMYASFKCDITWHRSIRRRGRTMCSRERPWTEWATWIAEAMCEPGCERPAGEERVGGWMHLTLYAPIYLRKRQHVFIISLFLGTKTSQVSDITSSIAHFTQSIQFPRRSWWQGASASAAMLLTQFAWHNPYPRMVKG